MTATHTPRIKSGEDKSHPRKQPIQQRSRERVERILASASALIEESGSDALRMSDVADRAGISIGSLYQYFPDKGSIIRTLVERFNEEGRACVIAELAEIHSVEQLRFGLAKLLDEYYEMYLNTPVIIDIYSAARADHALKDIEIEDARKHAAFLLDALKRIWPERDEARLTTSSLLFFVLGTEAVRLAATVPREEGDAIVAEYKRLIDAQYSLDDSAS